MKRISFYLLLAAIALLGSHGLSAQEQNNTSIFDALASYRPGQGEVVIHQSDALRKLVGSRRAGDIEQVDGSNYLKMQGYRTQVFSGNNQRTSKDEAFKREKEIKALFPDLPTYVTYAAPFWKVRVGDYRSHEEAYHIKLELSKAFPSYGKEMYIVREEIRLPLF